MKNIYRILMISFVFTSAFMNGLLIAKCINGSHEYSKGGSLHYPCDVKKSSSADFDTTTASGPHGTTRTAHHCKNCGCDISLHDDN